MSKIVALLLLLFAGAACADDSGPTGADIVRRAAENDARAYSFMEGIRARARQQSLDKAKAEKARLDAARKKQK